MEIERPRPRNQARISKKEILIIAGVIFLLIIVGLIVYFIVSSSETPSPPTPGAPTPGPTPGPPSPSGPGDKNQALVASNGTMNVQSFPFLANDSINKLFTDKDYENLITATFTGRTILPCTDKNRDLLITYLNAVYYNMNTDYLQRLTTKELLVFYRSLVFYFITTQEKQPDDGWYGDYWQTKIIDEGPYHNKNTGETNMTAFRGESFLFDQVMLKTTVKNCVGYEKQRGKCPEHAKFWGNRIFPEMSQASMRRGMRNSPQVLAEKPSWAPDGKINPRFGDGGFPSNVYLEMLQFPEEHGAGGWPTGCSADGVECAVENNPPQILYEPVLENFDYQGGSPRFQPDGKNRTAGGDPYAGMKPQWFYPAQGLGQFWNLGQTSYCFNYVDLLLNAPMKGMPPTSDKSYPIGWGNGFASCTEVIKFPPGAGALGYDIENPTEPTEHDYNDPVYSMLLILEFESRNDVPGACKDAGNQRMLFATKNQFITTTCHQPLKDVRTGMSGLGYCAPTSDKGTACACPTSDPNCLYQPSPPMGGASSKKTYGCAPDQPANSSSRALNEQVCALMGQKPGTYWTPYFDSSTNYVPFVKPTPGKMVENFYHRNSAVNSKKGIAGQLNSNGGFDPNPAWAKVRKKSSRVFPTRPKPLSSIRDKRYMAVGWINGNFYGYPKGKYIPGDADGKIKYNNPFQGGVPGLDVDGKTIIYGKITSEESPLTYYDRNGKVLYKTWYNKQLDVDEATALELCAEFYSCGDNGFEQAEMNWPFGTYFGYGQSLGGIGKSATQAMSAYPYSCTSVQFTNTATAYGSIVQPAYDTEILYMPPVKSSGSSAKCTCATSVTVDLLADFNTPNAGRDLKTYVNRNKGKEGGFVYVDSPAGKSARAFFGKLQKVTNWTTLSDPYANEETANSFDPSQSNSFGVSGNPPSFCGL